jgi:single-stranded DNA-binding protein
MSFLRTSSALRRSVPTFTSTSSAFLSAAPRRSFAKLTLVGRLGAAPELITTPAGTEQIRYVVASSESIRPRHADGSLGEPKTNWFRVSARTASMSELQRKRVLEMPKGTQVLVEGEPMLRSYAIEDGKTASALVIAQREYP